MFLAYLLLTIFRLHVKITKLIRKLNRDMLTFPKRNLHEDCQKQNAAPRAHTGSLPFQVFVIFSSQLQKAPAKTENWLFSAHPPISSVHTVRSSREEVNR